jgi:iron(III) transport system ATP-binding protein
MTNKTVMTNAAPVEFRDVTKIYGKDFVAVDNISLKVEAGSLVTLLGPSGCGKTTTLRMIAGLESVNKGQILIDGVDITQLPATERDVSMVFQSYALFPHKTVLENVSYGLIFSGLSKQDAAIKAEEGLGLVGLEHLGARYPSELSGGQQQRVAVARALVLEPQVLLFDEPLSNLDAKLRRSVRNEIRDLQQKLGLTVVYVTHDQEEALAVSDKIIVMNKGQIAQIGTPHELYESPSDLFVANFIGESNIIDSKIERISRGKATIKLGEQLLQVNAGELEAGPIKMVVRPEDVTLHVKKIKDSFAGVIETATYVGSKTEYQIRTKAGSFFVTLPSRSTQYAAGTKIHLSVDPDVVRLFPVE